MAGSDGGWVSRLLERGGDALTGLGVRLRAFVFRAAAEDELGEEIRFHVEMETRKLIERGVPPAEARRRALVEFGGVERFKERTRDARSLPIMEDLTRNLRLAVRRLWSRPLHTLTLVGTLALGIGASTAIFSVVNAVLLRSTPFPDSDRLVVVWETDRDSGTSHEPASWPDVVDFAERTRTLSSLGAMVGTDITVLQGEVPERVDALGVTPSFLEVLGVAPLEGRLFSPGEGSDARPYSTVILGEDYWRETFGGDPAVVGRTLALEGGAATIAGVLPAGVELGIRQIQTGADYGTVVPQGGIDLWIARQPTAETYPRATHGFFMLGRLAPGASVESAQEELSGIARELEHAYPVNDARGVNVEAYSDVVFGPVRTALFLLLGAVLLVLLVSCVNVANLLLAETAARRREVALRRAFGAGRGRIRSQFLTESMVLTAVGTLAGIGLAFGGLELLLAFAPGDLPRVSDAGLDLRVLGFTAVLAAVVTLLFGLLPSLQSRSVGLQESLKALASRVSTEGAAVRRYRGALVVFEVAMAVFLVVGAGILLRSFWELQSVDPGFRTQRIVKAEYELPARYSDMTEVVEMHQAFLSRARRIPGVEDAALASNHPLDPGFTNSFVITGREDESAEFPEIRTRFISADYPRVMDVPVLEGRGLGGGDVRGSPYVMLINETASSRFFPDGGAVGQELRFWGIGWRIVGILGDERFRGLDQPVDPAAYVPLMQIPFNQVTLLLRSERDPSALAAEARRLLRDVDPGIAVAGVVPLERVLDESLTRPRFLMTLLGIFAAVAILLALIGVYGVLSHSVARRAPDLGIRLAMGAQQADIFREVVLSGIRLTALGVVLGALAALAASRILEGFVFGVSVTDVPTYLAVVTTVLFAATLASLLPAMRAARQDPVGLLRAD